MTTAKPSLPYTVALGVFRALAIIGVLGTVFASGCVAGRASTRVGHAGAYCFNYASHSVCIPVTP